jgi:hypothetical protein
MNAQLLDGTDGIVAKFADWVKSMSAEFAVVDTPQRAMELEQRIRSGGREILLALLQERLQTSIKRSQGKLRECAGCGGKRRHRGTRKRRLDSSLGSMELEGIYWQCPDCGDSRHSVDAVTEDRLSGLFKEMVLLLGVGCTSFAKSELLAETLLGVQTDDDTIRRTCEAEGQLALSSPTPPVPAQDGSLLWGSCDGTMVNTREDKWREVKAARFRHAGGEYALATLEPVEGFVPKMVALAQALTPARPGKLAFTSDCAEWITRAVGQHLPGWTHIADYWHACQHIGGCSEEIHEEGSGEGEDWLAYFSQELRCAGGGQLADELRLSAMSYPNLRHQRKVLDLAKFFDKHAGRMDYPQYIREGLPVDSGAMESLCKQLGLRMKGPGMRWSTRNVSAMACLVARWAVDPARAVREGLAA